MLKKILFYAPSLIIPIIGNLFIILVVGKVISPSQFGVYNILFTITTLSSVVLNSFTNHALLRLYDEKKTINQSEKLFSTLILCIIGTFPVILLILLIFDAKLFLVSLSITGYGLANYVSIYFRVKNKLLYYNFVKSFPVVLQIIIISLIIKYSDLTGVSTYAAQFISIFLIIVSILVSMLLFKKIKLVFSISLFQESLKVGLPLTMVNIVSLIFISLDSILLLILSNKEELGFFSFSMRISDLSMLTLANLIMFVLYPTLISIYNKKGSKEASLLLNKFFNVQISISMPIILIGIFFFDELLNIFFPQYREIGTVFKLTWVGSFLFSLTYYTNKPHELNKKVSTIIKSLLIALVFKLVFGSIIINIYGSLGAAISVLLSSILYFYLTYFSKLDMKWFHIKWHFHIIFISLSLIFILILDYIISIKYTSDIKVIYISLIYVSVYYLILLNNLKKL